VPAFRHVVVVVFENKERSEVVGNPAAPTFARLARLGAALPRYDGVSHPSLPNYLALVSGSTHGITSDCTDCLVPGPSLADSLRAAGKTWKTYAEGLPAAGFTGGNSGRYAKKHDPFLYFRGIDVGRVVPFPQLRRDLAARALPDFALVVPDLCNDMHDCAVGVGDAWLARTLPPLLRLPGTAVFVVFDEGATGQGGGGNVPAFVVGTVVRPHSTYRSETSHYGLLRTIEDAWGLPRLGRSAGTAPITGIWRNHN
jgi:phosphatidylinositol-3-phosphatase